MSHHLMIDIETLSGRPDALVLQVGAVLFEPAMGTLQAPGRKWDLRTDEQENDWHRDIEARTVLWWAQQSAEARTAVLQVPSRERVHPAQCLVELGDLIDAAEYVWARGPAFDLAILNSLYAAVQAATTGLVPDRKPLFPFWKWRDERVLRDLLDAVGYGQQRHGVAHDALDDAVSQANNVLRAYEVMRRKAK